MLKVRSPGKIMLAGEWSVLETGNHCIVTVVDRFVEASIKPANNMIFHAPDVGLNNVIGYWDGRNFSVALAKTGDFWTKFKFCFYATQVTLQFLQDQSTKIENFELSIKSDLSRIDNNSFLKFGFGSSAATTVSVCKAILAFYGYDVDVIATQETVFKLACIAHFLASEKIGSGFDVAASAFQSPLVYSRFESSFLQNATNANQPICEIVSMHWPCLSIEKIKLPPDLKIVVGFSGNSASTTEMVKKMHEFKLNNFDCYKGIFDDINSTVTALISAIKNDNKNEFLSLIKQNRKMLLKLSSASEVEIETPTIKHMIVQAQTCGAAAKVSGAGGGDSVIAFCLGKDVAQTVQNTWTQSFILS